MGVINKYLIFIAYGITIRVKKKGDYMMITIKFIPRISLV